jgi:hypothetical protein
MRAPVRGVPRTAPGKGVVAGAKERPPDSVRCEEVRSAPHLVRDHVSANPADLCYPISDLSLWVRVPAVASAARHSSLCASDAGSARLNRKPCAS